MESLSYRVLAFIVMMAFDVRVGPYRKASRPDRIVPIAERFGMDAGAVLDNVKPNLSIFFNLIVFFWPTDDDSFLSCIFLLRVDHIRACLHIRASVQLVAGPGCQNVRRALPPPGLFSSFSMRVWCRVGTSLCSYWCS